MQTISGTLFENKGSNVEYRIANPGDIPIINEMFFADYGCNYPYPMSSFDPEGVYIIALMNDEVVGFARAAPYAGDPSVYEFGGLIVKGNCRGHGIAKSLLRLRMGIVKNMRVRKLVAEPVCYRPHCESQVNLVDNAGFVLTGLQPLKYPGIKYSYLSGQPESVLVAIHTLNGGECTGGRTLFIPDEWKAILFKCLPGKIMKDDSGFHMTCEMPDVIVHHSCVADGVRGSEFVDVPVNWPGAISVIRRYVEHGFRFAGLLPGLARLEDGTEYDLVRLCILQDGVDVNWGLIHVEPRFSAMKVFSMGHFS